MRKLNEDKLFSEEDIAWLRQSGMWDAEMRIAANAEKFGGEVPEAKTPEDPATKSALEVEQRRMNDLERDPTQAETPSGDEPEDDGYDGWTKPDLEAEVKARNDLEGTTNVEVVGTGKDGNVLKEDLIKGLRLWDQDNPDALKDDDSE